MAIRGQHGIWRAFALLAAIAVVVAVTSEVLAGAGAPADPKPGGPSVTGTPQAWAVAAPGIVDGPALGGDRVAWTVATREQGEATKVMTADRGRGARRVQVAGRPGALEAVSGRNGALGVYRNRDLPVEQRCDNKPADAGDCDPPPRGEFLIGGADGPLRPHISARRPSRATGRCRRRLRVIEPNFLGPTRVQFDGRTAVHLQRTRCLRPRLKPTFEVVATGAGTKRSRLVTAGEYENLIAVAGRFVAVESGDGALLQVFDLRTGKRVQRFRLNSLAVITEFALGPDGAVILSVPPDAGSRAPLFLLAPGERRPRRLPHAAACSPDCTVVMAAGRFAYTRYVDEDRQELTVETFEGASRPVATFEEQLGSPALLGFDFDGVSVSWVTGRDRPYRGKEDVGLEVNCYGKRPHVVAEAPVVHTTRVGVAPPADLPRVPAPRTFSRKRPYCPGD